MADESGVNYIIMANDASILARLDASGPRQQRGAARTCRRTRTCTCSAAPDARICSSPYRAPAPHRARSAAAAGETNATNPSSDVHMPQTLLPRCMRVTRGHARRGRPPQCARRGVRILPRPCCIADTHIHMQVGAERRGRILQRARLTCDSAQAQPAGAACAAPRSPQRRPQPAHRLSLGPLHSPPPALDTAPSTRRAAVHVHDVPVFKVVLDRNKLLMIVPPFSLSPPPLTASKSFS